MDREEILKKQRTYIWPNQILYYSEPVPLERGDGMYVWDVEDKKYLDFFAGILTTSVGHNNPTVNKRIKDQVEKILHTSTLYPHQNQVELGESLSEITPGDLNSFYFGTSGTDADESAIVLAQLHTGYTEVIALRHGYSGRSPMATESHSNEQRSRAGRRSRWPAWRSAERPARKLPTSWLRPGKRPPPTIAEAKGSTDATKRH